MRLKKKTLLIEFLKIRGNPILEKLGESKIQVKTRLHKILARPQVSFNDISQAEAIKDFFKNHPAQNEAIEQAEILVKYDGYIKKEQESVEKFNKLENIKIPKNFNYFTLASISSEGKEKLNKIKPKTIGQASRISGVSPSDISVLLIYMGR